MVNQKEGHSSKYSISPREQQPQLIANEGTKYTPTIIIISLTAALTTDKFYWLKNLSHATKNNTHPKNEGGHFTAL
jgi:hypothetical protein